MPRFSSPLLNGLCWAAVLIALALANRFGLIADKDAAVMFAIVPALWAASTGRGQRCQLKARA